MPIGTLLLRLVPLKYNVPLLLGRGALVGVPGLVLIVVRYRGIVVERDPGIIIILDGLIMMSTSFAAALSIAFRLDPLVGSKKRVSKSRQAKWHR